MAQQVITQLIDDLDGTDTEVETVEFQLDGTDFKIDLGPENAARLRQLLLDYAARGRRVGGRRRRGTPRPTERKGTAPAVAFVEPAPASSETSRGETRSLAYAPEVREWALANGLSVSPFGRMPNAVVEAYLNRGSRKGRRR